MHAKLLTVGLLATCAVAMPLDCHGKGDANSVQSDQQPNYPPTELPGQHGQMPPQDRKPSQQRQLPTQHRERPYSRHGPHRRPHGRHGPHNRHNTDDETLDDQPDDYNQDPSDGGQPGGYGHGHNTTGDDASSPEGSDDGTQRTPNPDMNDGDQNGPPPTSPDTNPHDDEQSGDDQSQHSPPPTSPDTIPNDDDQAGDDQNGPPPTSPDTVPHDDGQQSESPRGQQQQNNPPSTSPDTIPHVDDQSGSKQGGPLPTTADTIPHHNDQQGGSPSDQNQSSPLPASPDTIPQQDTGDSPTGGKKNVTPRTYTDLHAINDILAVHNKERALRGVRVLEWAHDLAEEAQSWTGKCTFDNPNGGQSGFGQNLSKDTANPEDVSTWTQWWVDEKAQYNFGNLAYQPGTGHFTQVIWAATTQVGCGWTRCKNTWKGAEGFGDGTGAWFYICNYREAGNVLDKFSENIKMEIK